VDDLDLDAHEVIGEVATVEFREADGILWVVMTMVAPRFLPRLMMLRTSCWVNGGGRRPCWQQAGPADGAPRSWAARSRWGTRLDALDQFEAVALAGEEVLEVERLVDTR
jgi:hypothetical protein